MGNNVRFTVAGRWPVLGPIVADAMATGVASWVPCRASSAAPESVDSSRAQRARPSPSCFTKAEGGLVRRCHVPGDGPQPRRVARPALEPALRGLLPRSVALQN